MYCITGDNKVVPRYTYIVLECPHDKKKCLCPSLVSGWSGARTAGSHQALSGALSKYSLTFAPVVLRGIRRSGIRSMLPASGELFQCHWLGMVVHLDRHCSKAFELFSTKVGHMLYLTFVWRVCAGYQRCTEYMIIGKG